MEHVKFLSNLFSSHVFNTKLISDFTFSEPCIVVHIRENNQQDVHFTSLIYSNETILYIKHFIVQLMHTNYKSLDY